jgi:hypothetical protein
VTGFNPMSTFGIPANTRSPGAEGVRRPTNDRFR